MEQVRVIRHVATCSQCSHGSRDIGTMTQILYCTAKMEPSEVEFLAENTTVSIVTNFSENRLTLLTVSQHELKTHWDTYVQRRT